ncbi:hypothetical protein D1227_06175 [Henriciella mobilis]|uniref:hypothetical protein n=1 Tax=Henriciella mobilis TaxID=2305467 RepID=UPI000E66B005|nr:hypothetical protein [Henriciella mobilis]RIJ16001.1 hypothetical protein D1231_09420 [Henriciella mobilis]RIJ21212.1 hypothetical protein D1227_12965 [Henriciella mobilis]RIJ23087.1 hypothetical protein D1227_06175 [Henriciella mobilis]
MKKIWESAKREFTQNPVTTLGAIAAVLALFTHNPEILNVMGSDTGSIEPTARGKSGIVTWVLLYVAVCFLLGWWGSNVYKSSAFAGVCILPVFGFVAAVTGMYLASIHLASFPLIESGTGSEVAHQWLGLPSPIFALVFTSVWGFMSLATYLPQTDIYEQRAAQEEKGIYLFAFFVVEIVSLGSLWIIAHSLLFALVEPTIASSPE